MVAVLNSGLFSFLCNMAPSCLCLVTFIHLISNVCIFKSSRNYSCWNVLQLLSYSAASQNWPWSSFGPSQFNFSPNGVGSTPKGTSLRSWAGRNRASLIWLGSVWIVSKASSLTCALYFSPHWVPNWYLGVHKTILSICQLLNSWITVVKNMSSGVTVYLTPRFYPLLTMWIWQLVASYFSISSVMKSI